MTKSLGIRHTEDVARQGWQRAEKAESDRAALLAAAKAVLAELEDSWGEANVSLRRAVQEAEGTLPEEAEK